MATTNKMQQPPSSILKRRLCIYGYIKEAQATCNLSNNIPEEIAIVIISFHNSAPDEAIIIDNGTGMIRAGYSGEDAPRIIYPSVVGYPKDDDEQDSNKKIIYIGNEALVKQDELQLKYPMRGYLPHLDVTV